MPKHVPALDGIRGTAILLVLMAHLVPYSPSSSLLSRLINGAAGIGWSGVSLFFVLSGFLITGLLHDAKQSSRYFRNFYARRTLRICPLYFLLVLFCVIILPKVFGLSASRPVADVWMYWCYLSNVHESFRGGVSDGWIGPLWSLAVEEHFYLVWPLAILAFSRVSAMRVCIACMLAANFFRIWFVIHGNLSAPYFFTLCRMDDLAIGSLLALALKGDLDTSRLRKMALRITLVVAPLVASLAVWKHGVVFTPAMSLAGLPLVGILFGCLLALAVLPGSPRWTATMSFGPLRSFGKYSFGLYMYHPAVAGLMTRFSLLPPGSRRIDDLVRALILLTLTYGVALVSFHLFEQRFLKLKRYFESGSRKSTASAVGVPIPAYKSHEAAFEVEPSRESECASS